MDYATVYISLICKLVFSTANKFTVKPICNGLCNCVYKFNCKLVFSTANKFTVKPICNGLCNCVYKFNCKLVFSMGNQSLQLSQFVMDYATVYISLIVNLYLARQTSLQLSQFVMDYATVYISLIVTCI